jgi:hypothetical protein
MSDWIGLIFFALLIVGIIVGLKLLSKPQKRTAEDFERNVSESTSMLGAGVNALQEALDPAAAKSKEVQTQLKEGRYDKKQREGKANGTEEGKDNE